ncbi:putative cysteine proteinase [Trypanosoma rangeli]|uniref:Putative cysteine proteinase n=1 Tax=Trypanosoma rangeli TaxID=5698 RepID=A0A422NP53_TRYRA|nr:putative cysteine proteinase [Trypanosoma rangeli]RNF07280.1 putative cysteine proteinase [Trypanosoma rangeli]|eukprot:RNF07280.1 putative cysteine proteinase [Trypanosoma rangeli]
MSINYMLSWMPEEFARLNRARSSIMCHFTKKSLQRQYKPTGQRLRNAVDYRNYTPAVLTPVKNQGSCGNCWVHAAVEGVETLYVISTERFHVMSQQGLTTCVSSPYECGGIGGCHSATEDFVHHYTRNGITTVGIFLHVARVNHYMKLLANN